MVILRDTVEINAPVKEVYSFFLHFQENYLAWHPDHTFCRYLTDGPLRIGSVIYVEEVLHGRPHRLKMRLTGLELNSRIDYQLFPGAWGSFIFDQKDARTSLFTAELRFGLALPILGKLLDPILRLLLSSQLQGIERHMNEEGKNLKKGMEQWPGLGYRVQP